MLTIGLLGPVEVWRDGQQVPIPAGKTTELLARLATQPGIPVRVDALVEDLWGEPTARNTLQSKVSQLRRALGSVQVVRGRAETYTLDLDPTVVDAHRAAEHGRAAAVALAAGDAGTAVDEASRGLQLFRGDPLPSAGAWASTYRAVLTELRWSLTEDLLAARVDLGAGGDVVAELERLVAEQPLRERLWASLITALYRAGRQADALAAGRRVRSMLADELGVDPGPQLQELELLVLRQSPALAGDDRRRAPMTPGNLPPAAGRLIGRADRVAELVTTLEDPGVVTVAGLAGVGKTALALEVAGRVALPGGAWLVRLEAFDADADLGPAVAEALHVVGGRAGLVERLRGAETLVLLDNCEHVLGHVRELVTSLVAEAPSLRVLATSQVPLGLPAERIETLAPLPVEDSVELFRERAERLRQGFALDDASAALVAGVCQALDGLPLAIELAAARIRSLPLPEIARRLDDRFALLRDPGSALPERRRALQAALEWSYELLFPDDQRGLWALSRFADGATLGAFERVLLALDVPTQVVPDVLTRLVDRSLVVWDPAAPPGGRYRLLNSVRTLAGERLDAAGLTGVAAAAHASWYADRAGAVDSAIRTAAQPECLAEVRAERADIDLALAWCRQHDPAQGARIALGFGWAWMVLGDGTAAAARIRSAVPVDSPAAARTRAGCLAAWLEASAGDLRQATADLGSAALAAADADDELLVADACLARSFVAIQEGRPAVVRDAAADALRRYRHGDLEWQTAAALLLGAYGALMVGDVTSAERSATEAVELLRPLADSWGLVHAQGILAGVADAQGRHQEAAAAYASAADAAATLGFPGQAALHRASWARALERCRDPQARTAYEAAIGEALSVADLRLAAGTRLQLARQLRRGGDDSGARALLRANARWLRDAAGGEFALLNDVLAAALDSDREALEAARAKAHAVGDVIAEVGALDALALGAATSEHLERARALLEESDELAGAAGHRIDPLDRTDATAARTLLAGSTPRS